MLKKKIFTIIFFLTTLYSFCVNNNEVANMYYIKGVEFGRAGKLDSALVYTKKAIELVSKSKIKDSTLLGKAYQSIGIVYGRTGKLDSAIFYTTKALDIIITSEFKDSTLLGNVYQSLGIINKLLGKYDEAIKCYNKAEAIYLSNNNTFLLGFIYGNKANIFRIQQDYTKAKDFHFREISIFKNDTIKYKNQLALAYNNLGLVYLNKGDFENAKINFLKNLVIKRKDLKNYLTLGNLAICYEKLNDNKRAESFYLQAIKTLKNSYSEDNIWLAYQQMRYAKFLANQNRNEDEIMRFYFSSLKTYKSNYGLKHPYLSDCLNNIGEFYLANSDIDSALYYFQESLIALSYDFNNKSLAANPKIENIISKTHLLSALKNKASALSLIAEKNNNIEYFNLSLNTYDLAIQCINKIRSGYISEESKLFLAENSSDIYSKAIQTSYALYNKTKSKDYLNKAFYYSESGKSAILNEAIQNTKALNIGGIPDSLITQEKQLEKSIWAYEELIYEENKKKEPSQNSLEYWNKYLFEQKQEYAKLSEYLENNFKKYLKLKEASSKLSIEDVQAKLSKNEVLIEFYLSNEHLYTFLIGKDENFLLKQEINGQFNKSLDYMLKSLSNNNFSNHGLDDFLQYQESSSFLYSRLLKPLENKIKDKSLIVIPDGKLSYLPFEVLTTENKKFTRLDYKNLDYFVYKNNINYSYTAGFLFENGHKNKTANRKLGAFAPTYDKTEGINPNEFAVRQQYREILFPLKGIKEEVENISDLVAGDTYLDLKASEKTFKEVAASYDILHLAMHTIMDDQNPMYSKMAFSQSMDSSEDGFLNTYELYNMKLNSRMTVLSSCNSGSGKFQRGEGVMSLARGFIYSGCPSIIMTLWSVEDKSGVNLMTSFYKYLVKGYSKSESLKRSKIDFINNADQLHAHPYFWSGYVVIGSNRALFHPYIKYSVLAGILMLISLGMWFFLRSRKKNKKNPKQFVFRDVDLS